MKNFFFTTTGAILASVVVVALLFVSAMINGYVLSIIWEWFVSDIFKIQLITIPQSIGLILVLSALYGDKHVPEEESEKIIMVRLFARPFMILLVGYVVTLFL